MRHCEYIKPNGNFCGSPALRGRDYCYWHLTHLARRLRAEKQEATADSTPLELPPLEDANSVQLAIIMVMDAMLHDRIGPKKSGQLLYALQLASSNLKQGVCFQPGKQANPDADEKPEPEPAVLCSSYDSLEADYDIQEHAEQLHAAGEEAPFDAETETEREQPKLSETEQYRKAHPEKGEDYYPSAAELDQLREQQQETEEHKLELRKHLGDLAQAAGFKDAHELKEFVDDAYTRAGLYFETEGWKPAARQLVLFPRKPPESVQQQWYEQRLATCSAEMDKHIAQQEARRKSSA